MVLRIIERKFYYKWLPKFEKMGGGGQGRKNFLDIWRYKHLKQMTVLFENTVFLKGATSNRSSLIIITLLILSQIVVKLKWTIKHRHKIP